MTVATAKEPEPGSRLASADAEETMMSPINRREGLGMAAGVAAAAMLPRVASGETHGQTLALVEKGAGQVAFYDLASGRRTGAVALGDQPHEMVADAAGRFAYVGHYGVKSWQTAGDGGAQIWVIDLAARRLARTIEMAPLRRIHGMRMDAQDRLYALSESSSMLARFDRPATSDTPDRLVPVGGARSHYFVVRRDGARAYVADTMSGLAIMVDPEDASVAPVKRRIGAAPEGCALSPDERVFYVLDRPAGVLHALDAGTFASVAEQKLSGPAVRVVTQPDGRLIVASEKDASLSRLRPGTLADEATVRLPAPAVGLTWSPDRRRLYASLTNDRLATVDVERWRVIGDFATGPSPDTGVVF